MNSKNLLSNILPQKSFNKIINIPASKSHANRALVMGAILGNHFKVKNISDSSDVIHLLNSFHALGLEANSEGSSVTFKNSFPACEKLNSELEIDLKTGDGGTTNRFLIPLLSRGEKKYHLFPSEKLAERPIDDLINPLKKLDVKIETQNLNQDLAWMKVQGPARMYNTTKVEVDCSKSTQFASGLMLAFANLPLKIECLNVHASETYIEMTKKVIKNSIRDNFYEVPGDFSSLSYPLALAALLGSIQVLNVKEIDPFQADSIFVELLKNIGASVELKASGLEVSKSKTGDLRPFKFDVNSAPDLFPTLIFLCAHIEGESEFFNLKILTYKESDRLMEMKRVMDAFGVDYSEIEGKLLVRGKKSFNYKKAHFDPPRDHRIVMSAALFMYANSGGELSEADCVSKSYPDFFELLK